MRINKFLSHNGIASRRRADDLIKSGRVFINKLPANLTDSVSPDDIVSLDEKPVNTKEHRYLVFHKPVDTVCSSKQQAKETPTIYDVLPPQYQGLKYAWRLDRNTNGLMILTSDGDMIEKITHPSHNIQKVYRLVSPHVIPDQVITEFENGIPLDEGLGIAKTKRLDDCTLEMRIITGYNRQIRRMADKAGIKIQKLTRIGIGPLSLKSLGMVKPGSYKEIKKDNLNFSFRY